jgi:radical SAM protein with 4Fe4S-binding SPASM domain
MEKEGDTFANGVPGILPINDGKGFMFISHTGEVQPSGFLPLSAGNVRRANVRDIYRDSELFRNLRDTDNLQGKCGDCELREICGGSRARAYALSGNAFAEDPSCIYIPRQRTQNGASSNAPTIDLAGHQIEEGPADGCG